MEQSSEVKWLGIKPYLFRMFSVFMLLWSINQVVYSIIARSTAILALGPDTLQLLFPSDEPTYTTSLVLHSIGIVVFGIGTLIPSGLLMRTEDWWEANRERPTWVAGGFVYMGYAVMILLLFAPSLASARYQTYMDEDAGSVIKRQTHLLRPGVVNETILLGDVKEIILAIEPATGAPDYYLTLVLDGGREIEVGTTKGHFMGDSLVTLGHMMSANSPAVFHAPYEAVFC